MRPRVSLCSVIRIWLVLASIKNSQCENAEPRALDLSVPWRPLPYHVPQQQLISVASFDTTSKDELVHIAQHNAHILKHFNQPVTQYHNQNNFQQQQQQQQQLQHQPYKIPPPHFGGHTPGPKYMTTPLLLSNVSPAVQTSARHAKPFVKADQVTTLSIVHSSTPKSVTQISHLAPSGMKAAKFNAQFREPVLSAPPVTHPKSTLKPHPVMNNLPPHMAISYRQKQPVAAHSNRLEHFVTPNHLYGTYIQFGQAPNTLQAAKTKFISQLASHPSFDAQLKGLLHAGVSSGYQQTLAHIKHLQKMNYLQQQNKLQSYYNQIPADNDVPKKLVSSAEKETLKIPVTTSAPVFPHIPPSVLTPFFQQVQQQQHQNKYSFSLKTQHPAPPSASAAQSSHMFKEKPHKPQFHYESQQIHGTPLQSFKEHHGSDSFGFTSYQNHQQPPIDHKPHEIIKFKDIKQHNVFNEIHDEYSKNLVPPPPSTQQVFLPTVINHPEPSKNPIEILNKYNINSYSPLQDANRFSYEPNVKPSSFSLSPSSTPSTTSSSTTTTSTTTQPPSTTTPRQPYYSHTYNFGNEHNTYNSAVLDTPASNDWIGRDKYITTEKPNVFKQLFRPIGSEYKQHKLMHPGYTGLPPNKRPSSTTPVTISDSSTEEPLITHSFFTIEDALTDRNKYKYTTEAEKNILDEPEIVTIGPYVDSQELVTTAPYPMFRTKGKRRRPRPHHTTEFVNDSDSTENPIERPVRTRFRFRPKVTTEAEVEIRTTLAPPTTIGSLVEDTSLRKLRKKIPLNFNRNRFVANEPDLEQANTDQQDEPITQAPSTTTTTLAPGPVTTFINPPPSDNVQSYNGGNGLRSRYRPAAGDRYNGADQKPTRNKIYPVENSAESASAEIIRENESSRLNLKLPNYKPNLRLPSSGIVSSTTTTSASLTSDEITAESSNRTRLEPHRPRFSIKEYRNKINRTGPSTTTTTSEVEITTQPATKVRLPTRNRLLVNSRLNKTNVESNEVLAISTSTTEKPATATNDTTTTRTSFRPSFTRNYSNRFAVKKVTTDSSQQQTTSTPSRGVNRGRIRLQDTTTQSTTNRTVVPSTLHTSTLASRRPPKISLRQRIQNRKKDPENALKDSEPEASSPNEPKPVGDLTSVSTIDTPNRNSDSSPAPPVSTPSTTTEGYRRHETSIMKISPKDSSTSGSFGDGDWDLNSASSDYSKRVVELTLSASKDKGFKSVNKGLLSRRVPGYFTLATEDPILPIEAFFPQVKKMSA